MSTYDKTQRTRKAFSHYVSECTVPSPERDSIHYTLDDIEADIRAVTRELDDARLALCDYILTHGEGELDAELLGIAEVLTRARRTLRDPKVS